MTDTPNDSNKPSIGAAQSEVVKDYRDARKARRPRSGGSALSGAGQGLIPGQAIEGVLAFFKAILG